MSVRVTIKFLKRDLRCGRAVRLRDQNDIFEYQDPDYTVDNAQETIICALVPKSIEQTLMFDLLAPVRRVVLDGVDLAFSEVGNTLHVTLPPLETNRDRTADMHMIVPIPGVDVRVEVPTPAQSAGEYTQAAYPTRARRAATTLTFACLEAVKALGLNKTIGMGPCGPIYLMGFDTNSPCGHTDWPPHVHMHMAKPTIGAPIGHYYFNEALRLSYNDLYLRGSTIPVARFGPEDPCAHFAPDGSVLFDLRLTEAGGLILLDASGNSATISAIGPGFDTGALVEVAGRSIRIEVTSPPLPGEIAVAVGDRRMRYFYDVDTGKFLSSNEETSSHRTTDTVP